MRAPWLRRNLPSLVLFAVLLAAWQLAVSVFRVREYILPGPLSVLRATFDFRIPWWSHIWITGLEIVGAFLLAGVVGVLLGTAIAWSPTIASALVPFLVFVNTLPKVAVAPLFLLWLGYGILPNMLIGALIGFFPVVINTAVGLTQVDAEMLDLGRVFGAPKWKVFVTIRIPNAFPYILSALKITATAAVVGAIVGEFIASDKGLGYIIINSQYTMDSPPIFAGLMLVSLFDIVQVDLWEQPGLFVPQEYEPLHVLPFAVLGAMVCAFAGSLGSRWNRGIGAWLADELEEFCESIGMAPAADESEDATADGPADEDEAPRA